jgi:hypothetical protein
MIAPVRYLKVVVVVLALGAAVAPLPSAQVERLYSQGVYTWLQPPVTQASSLVPVALLDLSVAVLVTGLLVVLVRRWRARGVLFAAGRTALTCVVLAAVFYLWFLIFWGLNYRRVPLEEKLAYESAGVTPQRAAALARTAVARANALVGQGPGAPEDGLDAAFSEVERHMGAGRQTTLARPKPSVFGWYFRQAAIDGLTNPFFLEIVLHPDLLPFERPFVLAHEWAHLAGYADEAEANFIAWLTCLRGPAAAQYSGWLAAYQHLAVQLPRDVRQGLRVEISAAVAADLAAASRRVARASPVVQTAARGAYDAYLRANRVDEGIASYQGVVRLMLGTALDAEGTPRLRPN